jgi:hypothetical protein
VSFLQSSMSKKQAVKRICFVVSPIGQDGSEERRKADYVLRMLIRPALKPVGYSVPKRIDQLHIPGEITTNIVEQLEQADLVIVDLTGLNANVMFESGIRQAWTRPFIPIAPKGTKLPFDVGGTNTVFYAPLDGRKALSAQQKSRVILRIRMLAKRLLKKGSTSSPFDAAMGRFGEMSSLNGVYRGTRRALKSLAESFEGILEELEEDPKLFKHPRRKAFSDFTASIRQPFAALRDRLGMVAFIQNDDDTQPELRETCRKLCKRIKKLQKRGTRLDDKLKGLVKTALGGTKLKRFRMGIISEVRHIIGVTNQIRDRIKREALEHVS